MGEQFIELVTRKNLTSLLILVVLVFTIPVGVMLLRERQLFGIFAVEPAINFGPPNVEVRNGRLVALDATVGVTLTPPWQIGSGAAGNNAAPALATKNCNVATGRISGCGCTNNNQCKSGKCIDGECKKQSALAAADRGKGVGTTQDDPSCAKVAGRITGCSCTADTQCANKRCAYGICYGVDGLCGKKTGRPTGCDCESNSQCKLGKCTLGTCGKPAFGEVAPNDPPLSAAISAARVSSGGDNDDGKSKIDWKNEREASGIRSSDSTPEIDKRFKDDKPVSDKEIAEMKEQIEANREKDKEFGCANDNDC